MTGSRDAYALVTGASSGIGLEVARLLAKDGKNVVVVARRRDRLEALKKEIEGKHGTIVKVLAKDLSDPKAPAEVFSELGRDRIRVDVLVNNAGFGVYGKFSDTDLQKELEMVQVNAVSLLHLTKLFVKGMLEERSGYILNVASMCAFVPAALESVYCGTKALILHFSEALANELKGTGVTVTCLCFGLAKTEFQEVAHMEDTRVARRKMMTAAAVAEAALKDLKKGKTICIPGSLEYKIAPLFFRLAPRGFAVSVVRRQHERV